MPKRGKRGKEDRRRMRAKRGRGRRGVLDVAWACDISKATKHVNKPMTPGPGTNNATFLITKCFIRKS